MDLRKDWNPKQARLREIVKKKEKLEEAKALCLGLHALVHFSEGSDADEPTYADEIWNGLRDDDFSVMPTSKDVTIAWNIWHITRIEDITVNLLIADGGQVLDAGWLNKLNTRVTDTGNAMTDEEILSLSRELNKQELKKYRNAVGKRSREVICALTESDMRRRFSGEQLDRILAEGGLTGQEESIWLRDFWGRKDVAGILLMPVTRHQVVHLNDCAKLKKKIQK